MNKKYAFRSIICVLSILLAFTGCGKQEEMSDPQLNDDVEVTGEPSIPEMTEGIVTTEKSEESEEMLEGGNAEENTEEEQEPIDPNVVVISTVYGQLNYQEQWSEFMKVEQVVEDGALHVRFVAEMNGANYPLFALVINSDEEGAATQITAVDGVQRYVHVEIDEIETGDELPDEEQNRLYGMQEEINFVIDSIK